MVSNQLAPCPFCGGEACRMVDLNAIVGEPLRGDATARFSFYISCWNEGCVASGPQRKTAREAAAAWNARAAQGEKQ